MVSNPQALQRILAANAEMTMGGVATLLPDIAAAGQMLSQCYLADRKLLCCASATATAVSDYAAAIMMNRLEQDRPGLPTLSLSANQASKQAITDSSSPHEVYAKQIKALGQQQDCLLAYGSNSNAASLVQAVSAAREKQLSIIALTGEADNDISAVLTPEDLEINIPTRSHARLIEAQMLITHALCEIVEYSLFGIGDPL